MRDNGEAIREAMKTTSVRTTYTLAITALVAVLLSLLTGVANAQICQHNRAARGVCHRLGSILFSQTVPGDPAG